MKKLLFTLALVFSTLFIYAQENQDKGQSIALKIIVEDMAEPFPHNAKMQIENKLTQLLTQNGIASSSFLSQFFITAYAVPQTKDILPGPPTQFAETMDITFVIADFRNELVFASTSITTKGVGTNDAKSYMDAIKRINLNSPKLKEFVVEGKAKIVDYYNREAENMFAKALMLSNQKQFDEALFILTSIPSECTHYGKSLELANEVYQQYIDYQCQVNLAAAKAQWMAHQNKFGAEQAGEYLQNIYPDAACYAEAEALYGEIKAKVLDDWHFEMKKYQDGVDLELARIKSARDIGVAYGNHQQPTTTNIGFIR